MSRFQSFPELSLLQTHLARMAEQSLGGRSGVEGVDTHLFSPPVDIAETDESLEFYVELPGFEQEQIEIRVVDGKLEISGERRFERAGQDTYHRIERAYGKFQRMFSLPTSVDTSKINANLKNGILQLVLPKSEAAKPRQVQIKVG